MSGVYHIHHHFKHEAFRKVAELSCMKPAMQGAGWGPPPRPPPRRSPEALRRSAAHLPRLRRARRLRWLRRDVPDAARVVRLRGGGGLAAAGGPPQLGSVSARSGISLSRSRDLRHAAALQREPQRAASAEAPLRPHRDKTVRWDQSDDLFTQLARDESPFCTL